MKFVATLMGGCVLEILTEGTKMRVISIQDFSSKLIDAFMESEGKAKAVAFLDHIDDSAPIWGVEYDNERNCIVVRVGYPDVNVDHNGIKSEIIRINAE